MASGGNNPMDAVTALMQERQRVEEWLAALEGKRAITPPHVYERVRADYDKRLQEITQALGGRTNELRQMITALTARMARLQTEENARRDQRHEAELRATVGELEAAKWEALRRSIDDAIARMTAERTHITTELARLQQVLSMTGSAAAAPLPPLPPGVEVIGGAPAGASGRFDELAFLNAVTDPTAGPPPTATPPTSRSGQFASQSGAVATQAPPGGTPTQARPGAGTGTGSTGAVPPASGTGSQPAAPAPETPEYLKDVPTEATKTLKCNECGTMNFATEWYCERCGGELAAM
jgi:hypothetical protein